MLEGLVEEVDRQAKIIEDKGFEATLILIDQYGKYGDPERKGGTPKVYSFRTKTMGSLPVKYLRGLSSDVLVLDESEFICNGGPYNQDNREHCFRLVSHYDGPIG